MIQRFIIHLAAVVVIALATGFPALYAAVMLAETGLLGECREGGCGYTAIVLVWPLLWIIFSGIGIAIWIGLYRKYLRHRLTE